MTILAADWEPFPVPEWGSLRQVDYYYVSYGGSRSETTFTTTDGVHEVYSYYGTTTRPVERAGRLHYKIEWNKWMIYEKTAVYPWDAPIWIKCGGTV